MKGDVVYLVGWRGVDDEYLHGIYTDYDDVLKAWNEKRLAKIEQAAESKAEFPEMADVYDEIIKRLSCDNPEKIEKSMYGTPYLEAWTVR